MKRHMGFSLVELMISVLIVGILAAIAYPMYMDSVQRGNRSEAKAGLTQVAQRFQRCYSSFGRFNHAECSVFTELTTGTSEIKSEGREFYKITYEVESGQQPEVSYLITATADQPPQTNDEDCLEMTLDHRGSREPEECWR